MKFLCLFGFITIAACSHRIANVRAPSSNKETLKVGTIYQISPKGSTDLTSSIHKLDVKVGDVIQINMMFKLDPKAAHATVSYPGILEDNTMYTELEWKKRYPEVDYKPFEVRYIPAADYNEMAGLRKSLQNLSGDQGYMIEIKVVGLPQSKEVYFNALALQFDKNNKQLNSYELQDGQKQINLTLNVIR